MIEEEITGKIEKIIYLNEINGYIVFKLISDEDDDEIVASGVMPLAVEGERVKIGGCWKTHNEYGPQFVFEEATAIVPEKVDEIEEYLSSGIIKGVGPVYARKITDEFQEQTLEVLLNSPKKLYKIEGISKKKAKEIGTAFQEREKTRDVIMFFQKNGMPVTLAIKAYNLYGGETIEKIIENPYLLLEEPFNSFFKKVDSMALTLGIEPHSICRVKSLLCYLLSKASQYGHTYVPSQIIVEQARKILGEDIKEIDDSISELKQEKKIIIEDDGESDRMYLASFYNSEQNVCDIISELLSNEFIATEKYIMNGIKNVENEQKITLDNMQVEAVKQALSNPITVITGGPGTGKTTILKAIILAYKEHGLKVLLAAPTGRAAKRMNQTTSEEATTIHRLLEIGYNGEDEMVFLRNEGRPIEADALIIDESSMIDILLMNSLLKAVKTGTRIIFSGDVDQLPSVGPGKVLKDIIQSNVIKTVRLEQIFRQEEESLIAVNAHRVNKGDTLILNRKDKDFFFIQKQEQRNIMETIVNLCCDRLVKTYNFDPLKDIQVITPTKKGLIGTDSLNKELQKVLNRKSSTKEEKIYGDFIFREGDKIMQIKNNYELEWHLLDAPNIMGKGVFNGDVGIITLIDNRARVMNIIFDDEKVTEYKFTNLEQIQLSYAITVHKSQGSEFPVVLIPAWNFPKPLMNRNLLYTAITRAQKMVVIIGVKNCIAQMIANDKENLRFSYMEERLKNIFIKD